MVMVVYSGAGVVQFDGHGQKGSPVALCRTLDIDHSLAVRVFQIREQLFCQ